MSGPLWEIAKLSMEMRLRQPLKPFCVPGLVLACVASCTFNIDLINESQFLVIETTVLVKANWDRRSICSEQRFSFVRDPASKFSNLAAKAPVNKVKPTNFVESELLLWFN